MIKFYEKGKHVQLSKHLALYEVSCPCVNPSCSWVTVHQGMVNAFEELRTSCGDKPLTITSGYRCERRNQSVSGVRLSRHLIGSAFDMLPPNGISIEEFYYKARNLKNSKFDTVIAHDTNSGFLHAHINPTTPEEVILKSNVKETGEFLLAVNELLLVLISAFKDGVQASDFITLFTKLQSDPEFKKALEKGFDNYKLIPQELGDLSISEGAELAMIQIKYLPKIISAFK